MLQIIIADVSMSLDNVLAVAGIARENIGILVFGLVLSIVLMAVGATFVAKILQQCCKKLATLLQKFQVLECLTRIGQ